MAEVQDEKPRLLTNLEIDDILEVVPDIRSASNLVSEYNTKSAKVLIREQLKEIVLTPLGIPDLKAEIVRQFENSQVRPGEMVGIVASEALGKNITQSALNSFHSSGSAKNVSMGIDRINELINATKEPKNPSCSIFFQSQNLGFSDIIMQKRPNITEITVKDLVVGTPDISTTGTFVEPDWYQTFQMFSQKKYRSKEVLRLQLDVNLLYAYRITLREICQKIETGQPVVCVYSPLSIGQIDIYPEENMIISKLKEMNVAFVSSDTAGLIFLSMIVIPALDKLKVSGIPGIKQIFPVEAGVWQIVKEEQKFETGWFLILNTVRIRATGVTVEKLTKLCEVLGMKVVKIRESYIAVESEISPSQRLAEALEKDRDDEKEYRKTHKTVRMPSEIKKAAYLVYADSTGANLRDLLAHPDIDSTRTFSNNMHEIQQAFGIEAARSFLIQELTLVVSSDSYINPRHIVLLADFMTSLGKINGVTSTGISRQPIGALEKASNDKAMKHLKEAAVFGETKSVSGTSASIYVGKQALVGTGYSDKYIPPENLKRYNETRELLFKDEDLVLDANTFNDVIEQINLETGSDVAFLSGAMEEEMFNLEDTEILPGAGASLRSQSKPGKPSQIVEPLERNTVEIRTEPIRSNELVEAAQRLQDKIVCELPAQPVATKTTVVRTLPKLPSLKPLKSVVKTVPSKTGTAQIFDLEAFL